MLSKELFIRDCMTLFSQCPGNQVDIPSKGVITLFDAPMIGFADPADDLFVKYKEENVIGSMFLAPEEWLPEAKTVVSFFFPFSPDMRDSSRETPDQPSAPWMYARIEGQPFLNTFMELLMSSLLGSGMKACVPALDTRFQTKSASFPERSEGDFHINSTWSERHAAYAAGLGTFGLSKGLITEKGTAGRFASILLDAAYEPDQRSYTGIYDFCTYCGKCAANCPANAISIEYGKNNCKCDRFVASTKKLTPLRFGCGKCQVDVPCEFRSPRSKR